MSQVFGLPRQQVVGTNGDPSPGALVYFYLTGTSTPSPVYTTPALSVAHSNPLAADSAGVIQPLYGDPAVTYRVTVRTSSGSLLYQDDNVPGAAINETLILSLLDADSVGTLLYPRTAAEIAASVTPATYAYPQGDVRRYGAIGDGATDDAAAIQAAADVIYTAGGGTVIFGGSGLTYVIGSTITLGSFVPVDLNGSIVKVSANNTPAFSITKHASLNQKVKLGNGRITWSTAQVEATHPLSYGVVLSDTGRTNFDIVIHDLRVENGVGAVTTPTGETIFSFFVELSHVFASDCSGWGFFYGGSSSGSTFHKLRHCWVVQTTGSEIATSKGFNYRNIDYISIDDCGADHVQTTGVLTLSTCNGSINSFGVESCDISASSSQAAFYRFSNCDLTCNLLVSTGNTVDISGAADFGLIVVDTSRVRISKIYDKSTELTDTSSGAYYIVYCSGTGSEIYVDMFERIAHGSSPTPSSTFYVDSATDPYQIRRFDAESIPGYLELTSTGLNPNANHTIHYAREGNSVSLFVGDFSGTSNATTFTLGTLGTALRPARAQTVLCRVTDNGTTDVGLAVVGTDGVITFYKDVSAGAFTNSGTKGVVATSINYGLR